MVSAQDLVGRSHPAVCGVMERELTVPTNVKGAAIRKLKAAGFRIIGTSFNGGKTTKIWFIVRGGF